MISPDDLKTSEETLRKLKQELEVARFHQAIGDDLRKAEDAVKAAEESHRVMARAYTEQMQGQWMDNHRKQLFR